MANPVDGLVLDLLEWVGPRARPYTDAIHAWRTSDRIGAWEEANARGYINRQYVDGRGVVVSVSTLGRAILRQYRPVDRTTTGAPYSPDRPVKSSGDSVTAPPVAGYVVDFAFRPGAGGGT